MTTPSGQITISDINVEVGLSANYSSSLDFLKGYLKSPPASPSMGDFRNKAYYQRNADGNCNNGNCVASGSGNGNCTNQGGPNGNCTSDCNCGNINCRNCLIAGPSDCSNCQVCTPINCSNCANCNTINCANCDTQNYLQTNCNCACTYNCTQTAPSFNCSTSAVTYNCTTSQVSYNCNCNCACDCFWSDDTLKDRQSNIKDALDIVDQLEGFFYQGNQRAAMMGLNTQLDVGVSAQRVEEVFPVAMGPNMPGTQIKQVRYERMIPLLIEAIKELRKQINSNK